jgi:hypothetical protein
MSPREKIIKREYTHLILLVDYSESMVWPYLNNMKYASDPTSKPYKQGLMDFKDAIQSAHSIALDSVRKSAVCLDGYLKVTQCLFNHGRIFINEDELVSPSGEDALSRLYQIKEGPNGATALYDVVYETIQYTYQRKVLPVFESDFRGDQIIIALITDGKDTYCEGVSSYDSPKMYERNKDRKIEKIRNLMQKLKGFKTGAHNVLKSSVVIGLTNSMTQFTQKQLEQIKDDLYFDDCVNIDNHDEKSLREAFKLMSVNSAR